VAPDPGEQASAGFKRSTAKTNRPSWDDGLVACGDLVIELPNKELHLTRGAAPDAAPRR
jgi:hypothetical protein